MKINTLIPRKRNLPLIPKPQTQNPKKEKKKKIALLLSFLRLTKSHPSNLIEI